MAAAEQKGLEFDNILKGVVFRKHNFVFKLRRDLDNAVDEISFIVYMSSYLEFIHCLNHYQVFLGC